MQVTAPINRPLADEHVIGVDPPLQPELPDVWRRRINPFAGRALSDKALTAEQDQRSGMQRLRGLATSPGTVEGLDVLLDPGATGTAAADLSFQLTPGLAVARSGEDVDIGSTRRIRFADLPLILRTDQADALDSGAPVPTDPPATTETPTAPVAGSLAARLRPELPRRLGKTMGDTLAVAGSSALPRIGVIVAQPLTAVVLGNAVDACPPDPRDDAYVDLQRIDGCRIGFYLWPGEMTAIAGGPDYALPAPGPALRNQLAYRVFDNEALLLPGEMHPWEEWGVPLALAAFDDDWKLLFLDRNAVVRRGGQPPARTPMVAMSGDARLWQARIDQFVEQLAALPDFAEATLSAAFARMPPGGVLPPSTLDPVLRRQSFFPGSFSVSAVPVPLSNLDLAVHQAAGLVPLNRSVPDRVELLVPVPDAAYDPGLLLIETEDPAFATAITTFLADRTDALVRREAGRRRYGRLLETISGQIMGWPAGDLPLAEDSPPPGTAVPVETTRTRRFDEASAARTHSLSGALSTLTIAATDTVWAWVRIHSANKMTGLSLRLGTGTGSDGSATYAAGVYWGAPDAMPIAAEAGGLEARRAGDLPPTDIWVRLEVPASGVWDANGGSLDGFALNAVEFTQRGGQVEWGAFGTIDGNGQVYTYLADDAPSGSRLQVSGTDATGWPWATVPGRDALDIPDFGTVEADGVRDVTALDDFRAQWSQDFLAADIAAIDEGGLAAFLATVQARLKATNDAIDLGFVRARSDIYRVRQIMLGADAASRLVTSPALADLALRDEGARATSKDIDTFLSDAVTRSASDTILTPPPSPTPSPSPTPAPTPTPSSGGPFLMASIFQPREMTLNIAASSSVATRSSSTVSRSSAIAGSSLLASTALATTPLLVLDTGTSGVSLATTSQLTSINAARLGIDTTRYDVTDVQAQLPIAGLVERTVSVAERLTPPPAMQALSYALASKGAAVSTLAGLLGSDAARPTGIALADLIVPGFHHKTAAASDPAYAPRLDQLVADQALPSGDQQYVDADTLPSSEDKHESDYFTAAVQAIDNTIALMRLVEGRVALFDRLAQSITDLEATIQAAANDAAAWLRTIDLAVEQARHDLATAQALRLDETARVDAINTRRAAVLATQVKAIAYRRVREAAVYVPAPLTVAPSALVEDPVVACNRDHPDVPEEVQAYTDLFRDVPVSWFPKLAAAVATIPRLDAARATLVAVRTRAQIAAAIPAPAPAPAPTGAKFLRSVQLAAAAQRVVLEQRRVVASAINLAAIGSLSLVDTQTQIQQLASVSDLLDPAHRQPALAQQAGDLLRNIAQVAACLHAGFGEVAPAIRLAWADTLSEFDQPAPLASLANLPQWGDVPIEQRRTLQGLDDWLLAQIDTGNVQASGAMSELVRIALLMAAHAPVDRIIPARLVAPAPARVGAPIRLAVDISKLRIGMATLIRDKTDTLVSQAVVSDLSDGFATATIVKAPAALTTITSDLRFQFVSGKG